jgi:uncharacterized protein DUF6220
MRKLFLVTAALALLSVLAQFYFAGLGVFRRPEVAEGFAAHAINAGVVQGVAVLNAVAAGLARAGRHTVLLAALPVVLVFVQYAIFALGGLATPEGTPLDADGIPLVVQGPPLFVVALHVLNALLVLGVTAAVLRRARALATAAVPTPAPART